MESLTFMLRYYSLNALCSSDRLHRTNCFCLCTFRPILTKSFSRHLSTAFIIFIKNFGLDQEFLVEMFYFFLAQVLPEFHQTSLIQEQFESNILLHQIVLMRTLVITCQGSVSVSESSQDAKQFSISPS